MKIKQHYGWGLFLIMALAPFVLSLYYVNILTEIFIFAVFAIGLNILVGQTGLVSLGHAAFFGAGAYATGIAAINLSPNIFLIILIGVLISASAGIGNGVLCYQGKWFLFYHVDTCIRTNCLLYCLPVEGCNGWFQWFIRDSNPCTVREF